MSGTDTDLVDALSAAPSHVERQSIGQMVATATRHDRGWMVRRLLAGADILGLVLAFALAQAVFGTRADWPEAAVFVLTLPVWIIVAKLYGLYDSDEQRANHSTVDEFARVFHLITVVSWLMFVVDWRTGAIDQNIPKVTLFWALAITLVVTFRAFARTLARHSPQYIQRTLIVGAGDVGQAIARKFLHHPEYGVRVLGFIDDQPREPTAGVADLTILGRHDETSSLVETLGVQRVIVAFSNESHEAHLDLLRRLKEHNVQVDVVPRLFEMIGSRAHLHSVEGTPLLGLPPLRLSRSSTLLKRCMDLALSTIGLIFLLPLLVAIAIAVAMTSPGPVFFRQVRIGHRGKPFRIMKFRTMVANAEELKADLGHLNMHRDYDPRMFKIPDDPRTTSVGRFLRRSALDELPQLVNVIRGEMSLVGPRPLILEEDKYIEAWGRVRLDLKPGITGPWQALGASNIAFNEMVRLDYLYIINWSLYDDVKWIAKTVSRLIARRNAY